VRFTLRHEKTSSQPAGAGYSDRLLDHSQDIAWKIVDQLDDWEKKIRLEERYERNHKRRSFRQSLVIYRYRLEAGSTELDFDPRFSIVAWSRDLTASGIGFVSLDQIIDDEIAIQFGDDSANAILVRAIIKRKRRVNEEFWEYGAEFQEKVAANALASHG
jgi:hypothetical protein